MQVTKTLMSYCQLGDRLLRAFNSDNNKFEAADDLIVHKEVDKLHSQCPGVIVTGTRMIKIVCFCKCHRKKRTSET